MVHPNRGKAARSNVGMLRQVAIQQSEYVENSQQIIKYRHLSGTLTLFTVYSSPLNQNRLTHTATMVNSIQ